jgi:hypothetical protein
MAHLAPALGGAPLVLLAAGRERRLVSPAQRKALIHRDHGCVYPGCDRSPDWCDAHHLDEWIRHSGGTDIDNLALVCGFHHARLHTSGMALKRDARGWRVESTPRPDDRAA